MVYRNNTGRLGFWLHQCVLRNTLAGSKTVVSISRNPTVHPWRAHSPPNPSQCASRFESSEGVRTQRIDHTTMSRIPQHITRLPVCTCCACFAKHMMMTYQQFPRIWYVTRAVWVSVISVRWSVICCQEWGCTRLLVGMLGHTGLVPFVD